MGKTFRRNDEDNWSAQTRKRNALLARNDARRRQEAAEWWSSDEEARAREAQHHIRRYNRNQH